MSRNRNASSEKTELYTRLSKIASAAPPPPIESLFRWLFMVYRMRRSLGEARGELLALANKRGITTGDVLLRAIIDETVGDHVSSKMKSKYAIVLEKALSAKIKSKNLRKFITDAGGINACASGKKQQSSRN